MTTVKLNPFSPVTFHRAPSFDRALDEVLNRSISSFFNQDTKQWHSLPAANVIENDKYFKLEIAVPGLTKENFKIAIEKNVLQISAENK